MMNFAKIVAMAAAIPKEQISVLDLGFDEDTVRRTMKLTGVEKVRYAPANMTALDYCLGAVKNIFAHGCVDANEIDGIIFVTPHPDYVYPGNSSVIQSKLGLSKRCVVFDINHSCTGMIYGFYLSDLLIRTGQCKNVLVCCGDTASHHLHRGDRALRMVVGDGGVAAVVSGGGNVQPQYAFCHDGDGLEWLYTPAGGERMPICSGKTDIESRDAEDNVRTLEDEYMDGMEVMRYVMNEIPVLIDEVLKKSGWLKDDVDVYALHQANTFIVKTLQRNMKLPKEKVLYDINGNGNIGGGSVALALCHAEMNKALHNKSKVVLAGFGAGMSGAAMSADLSSTKLLGVYEI